MQHEVSKGTFHIPWLGITLRLQPIETTMKRITIRKDLWVPSEKVLIFAATIQTQVTWNQFSLVEEMQASKQQKAWRGRGVYFGEELNCWWLRRIIIYMKTQRGPNKCAMWYICSISHDPRPSFKGFTGFGEPSNFILFFKKIYYYCY